MGMGMILVLVGLANAACPPLDDALGAATAALVDGADSSPAFVAAETSLACGAATRAQLAHLWLLRGAALQLSGDEAAAEPFYAAAATLDGSVWDDRLGPAVRASLAAAKHRDPGAILADRPVSIDGARVSHFPATVESGPHALQAADVGWARVVVVAPGDTTRVDVPIHRALTPGTKKQSPVWAVAGGIALAGAIGCGVGAVLQADAMENAETVPALDDAWALQQGLGGGAIVLGALGATGVVLQITLP